MNLEKYSISNREIQELLAAIKAKKIAIPEIQRPFVWKSTQVRDLIESLYESFPIGYIIIWNNNDARLKNDTTATSPDVIIDGQQRITAFMSALLGEEVLNSKYKKERIKIAFNPIEEKFQTLNSSIEKNSLWIPDISVLFNGTVKSRNLIKEYLEKNADKGIDEDLIWENVDDKLLDITKRRIGVIELSKDLDIEIVAEIFNRINSKGTPLDQYDFVMSKIASKDNPIYDGVNIRKAIDYFYHIAQNKSDFNLICSDTDFVKTPFFNKIKWVKEKDLTTYNPSYKDIIRVAFTHKFKKGKLNFLIQKLSGRNFEKETWEENIALDTFKDFSNAVSNTLDKTNFERFTMILESIGFIDSSLLTSMSFVNFAYILYLYLKQEGIEEVKIEKYVQKWFVLSVLTSRYTSSTETTYDEDIRKIQEKGIEQYFDELCRKTISDNFWENYLPSELETTRSNTALPELYWAVCCKDKTRGFLSKNKTVETMIRNRGDIHHLYPEAYLKRNKLTQNEYNQFANYVYLDTSVNIKIGDKEPQEYLNEVLLNLGTDNMKYSGIETIEDLKNNLKECDIPEIILEGKIDNYSQFLKERRKLMSLHIKRYWESL